jgi:hypothetical protein
MLVFWTLSKLTEVMADLASAQSKNSQETFFVKKYMRLFFSF